MTTISPTRRPLLAAVAVVHSAMTGCHDGTGPENSTWLRIEASGQRVPVPPAEAAFYSSYAPELFTQNLVHVVVGTGAAPATGGHVSVTFRLGRFEELPRPGTHRIETAGSVETGMTYASVYFPNVPALAGTIEVLPGASNSVTLDSVTSERIVGRFVLVAGSSGAASVVGGFAAVRKFHMDDLPWGPPTK